MSGKTEIEAPKNIRHLQPSFKIPEIPNSPLN
jgi:hypothetical protein